MPFESLYGTSVYWFVEDLSEICKYTMYMQTFYQFGPVLPSQFILVLQLTTRLQSYT